MSTHFRELIRPGTTFEFVGRARTFATISALIVLAALAMLPINAATRGSMLNWSIDFKGGTEIIMGFGRPVQAGELRTALNQSGFTGVDVSSFTFSEEGQARQGYLVRFPEFGVLKQAEANRIADQLVQRFQTGDRKILKATWSGETLFIRSTAPLSEAEIAEFLKGAGLEARPWTEEQTKEFATPVAGTNEYNYQVGVYGLDRQVQSALAGKLGTEVSIKQVDAVGPKAGAELRNDGIRSLLYAMALIMLYIAFRFDFRYGPGTVAAMLHDAIVVVGVFAVLWVEVSLTTVAALLTVIGYSMNDTVVVFDRIRENEAKLKDKKLDRIINISINETLSRTLLTSVSTFFVTLAMNLLGTGLVKNFAFAMNIGIVVGTYSSVFVAVPVLLWLNNTYFARRQAARRSVATSET